MSGRLARFTTLVFGVGALLLLPFRNVWAAPHNVSGWAWSGTTGWISMDCNTDPTACASGDYGVDIDASGNVSGWAWSSQAGWICFGTTCDGAAGVPATGTPSSPAAAADHYCPGFVPCARYDAVDGQLHGWAYIISQTDGSDYRGWVSLNCTDVGTNTASPRSCPAADYAVTFDEAATQDAGEFYGYAWNGNGDQTGNGWIQFGCGQPHGSCGAPGSWGVTSGWVNTGWGSIDPIEGIYAPWNAAALNTQLSSIPLSFKQFSSPAGATLRCVFRMSDNAYRSWSVALGQRKSRTNFIEYYTVSSTSSDAVTDTSGNPVLWSFSSQPPDPPFGCEIIGNPATQKVINNRVAVHPPTWTFSGPAGANTIDAVRAKYCLEGHADIDPTRTFFQNTDPTGAAVQCDTEGDLAFTLLRARGIQVEVRCYDNLDNDANLQRDCAGGTPATMPDRNCRGITYLCIPHPPASSPQPPRP